MKAYIKGTIILAWIFILGIAVSLSASSCDNSSDDTKIVTEIAVARSSVGSSAGSHLVSVQCSGTWRLTLAFADGDGTWATISPNWGTGSTGSVLLEYENNPSENPRTLTIILISEEGSSRCEFTQAGMDQNQVPKWMELPAVVDGDGLTFYTHPMTIDDIVTRNYSFYWDKENHVSHWVAYPLNNWLKGSGSRNDAWGYYDPLVPEEEQANLSRSYTAVNGTSYDRGHQIPSADRYKGDSNAETFYPTNMTPQESWFNQQLWTTLETKVRNWATASDTDTLYVVTGCVIDGWTEFSTDADGMACPIPLAYYKVVLRYSRASTLGYSGYMGAAFYLEHKVYPSTDIFTSMMMSIDEIEDMLGVDFFVNLPDAIGETAAANVESQNPIEANSWWGITVD